MEDIRVISYEVYVLGRAGWEMHARHPNDDRKLALTEAKTLEASMAAATKVVRSEYHPRSNTEERREIYASRLTPGEHGQRVTQPQQQQPARQTTKHKRKRHHIVHRRDMTPGAVLMRLIGILAASGLMATLMTMTAGMFLDEMGLFSKAATQSGKSMVYGIFLTTFLLMALPWIVTFARQIEVIGFVLPGPGNQPQQVRPAKRRTEAPVETKREDGGLLDPLSTADLPPIPRPEPLAPDEDDEDEVAAVAAPVAAVAPMAVDAAAAPESNEPEADDPRDVGPEAGERLLTNRRTLLRFLRSLVTDLRESRPNLNSFERYGLGLLLSGAVDQIVENGDLGPRGRAQLVREALGILGRQPGLIEAVEGGMASTLGDQRSARIMQAGRDAMLHFISGSRDFLAAVLSALEIWNRPSGATGGGVVAAMLVQAWPDEETALDLAYGVAQAHGGAIIGSVDGIALLLPGVSRAVMAALEMLPQLPAAARIGIEAAETATEDDAVRAVGAARLLCHAARPGQILCSAAVRALGGRVPGSFTPAEQMAEGGLPLYSLRPAAEEIAVSPPEAAAAAGDQTH